MLRREKEPAGNCRQGMKEQTAGIHLKKHLRKATEKNLILSHVLSHEAAVFRG